MKHLLCTCYWWLSDHADDIALAVVYTLLGALAAPLIICAAAGMYENAVRDAEPVNEAYWQERGYEPLPEVRSKEFREPEARQAF